MPNNLEYMRRYRAENKARLAYQEQIRHEEWRRKLLEIVGGSKCKDCPETDFRVLQFDHVGDDKECNVSAYLTKNWEKALTEAKKCEVVCANCHAKRTYERRPKYTPTESKWIRRSKTHCPQGHEMTEENTKYNPKRARYCITCHRERGREYQRRKRALIV